MASWKWIRDIFGDVGGVLGTTLKHLAAVLIVASADGVVYFGLEWALKKTWLPESTVHNVKSILAWFLIPALILFTMIAVLLISIHGFAAVTEAIFQVRRRLIQRTRILEEEKKRPGSVPDPADPQEP